MLPEIKCFCCCIYVSFGVVFQVTDEKGTQTTRKEFTAGLGTRVEEIGVSAGVYSGAGSVELTL